MPCAALALQLSFDPSARSRILQLVIQIGESIGEVYVCDVVFSNSSDRGEFEVKYIWIKVGG